MKEVVLGWGGKRDHVNSGSRAKAVALDVTPCPLAHLGLLVPMWQPQVLGPLSCYPSIAQACFPQVGPSVLWWAWPQLCKYMHVCVCIQHMYGCVCVYTHHAGVLCTCVWHEELSYRVKEFRGSNSGSVICWFLALGIAPEPLGAWGFRPQGDDDSTWSLGLLWTWNEFVHKRV